MANLFTVAKEGTPVQSASTLILPQDGELIKILGTTTINKILKSGRNAGSVVHLYFDASCNLGVESRSIGTGIGYVDLNGTIFSAQPITIRARRSDFVSLILREADGDYQWVVFNSSLTDALVPTGGRARNHVALIENVIPSPSPLTIHVGDTTLGVGGDVTLSTSDSIASIETKLEAIPAIGAGNVTVSGSEPTITDFNVYLTFNNALAGKYIELRIDKTEEWSLWNDDGGNRNAALYSELPVIIPEVDSPELVSTSDQKGFFYLDGGTLKFRVDGLNYNVGLTPDT